MIIQFEKLTEAYLDQLFQWLKEPHVIEFWDNSQEHKDDIKIFINGRVEPSTYANGNFHYWIARADHIPYALIMTIKENPGEDRSPLKNKNLSLTGNTYGIDYMIGNKDFLGKNLGAITLSSFVDFFRESIDRKADTFFIDPDANNPKALHVYLKAGFENMGEFIMDGNGVFAGKESILLVKRFN